MRESVERGEPWTFNKHLLVLQRSESGLNPMQIKPSAVSICIWVQIHDVPMGFPPNRVAEEDGNFIGKFLESNHKT